MAKETVANLDWNHLGFEYHDLPYSFNEEFKDGQWQGGTLTESSTLTLSEAAEVLHYGQEVLKGSRPTGPRMDTSTYSAPKKTPSGSLTLPSEC